MTKPITTEKLILSKVAQFSRLTAKVIEKGLQPLDITLQEMRIAGLMVGEEHLTQKELASKLSVKAATLSVAISKLEKQGLVKRKNSERDKRVNFLSLTNSKKFSQVDAMLEQLNDAVCHGISANDLKVATKVIDQLINNAQQLNTLEP